MTTQFETQLTEALNNLPINLPSNVLTTEAGNALSATKALQDGNGNNISKTYATKKALEDKASLQDVQSRIKINGDRGELRGYELAYQTYNDFSININSAETTIINVKGSVSITFTPALFAQSGVKIICLHATDTTSLTYIGANWANKSAPPKWGTKNKNLILVANFIGGRVILSVNDNDE